MESRSPFYESAPMLEVPPIPADDLREFVADLTPTLSVMWSGLTARQQRVLLTVALAEYLGASTTEFMRLAGVTSHAAISAALKTLVAGTNPLVEKTGSKYRMRHRYVQLWLVRSRGYVEQHIPALRDPDAYAAALARVVPQLARLVPMAPPGG